MCKKSQRRSAVKIKQVGCVCDFQALEGECEVKVGTGLSKTKNKKTKRERRQRLKKPGPWLKGNRGKTGERRLVSLSSPALWYDGCYAQQLCLPIKAKGVCGTISQGEGRREEEEGKNKVRKREPRH